MLSLILPAAAAPDTREDRGATETRSGTTRPALSAVPAGLPGAPAFPEALRERLAAALAARGPSDRPRTHNLRPDGTPLYSNRLLLESSPYLLQHAHNPVDWYAWGERAFSDARRLGRLVFVSIGYSTCHWCHVMEEETFDDPQIARFLNRHFVSIKVDREARPDIDAIYMNAVHAMGVHGGWPLSVWMTAERKPFFGGTYFPPHDRAGRIGFETVLRAIERRQRENPASLERTGEALTHLLRETLGSNRNTGTSRSDAAVTRHAVAIYEHRADREWGGVGRGAKFPSALPLRFLLQYAQRNGDTNALEMATRTLEKMASGGVRDHLGGGFHRYATDRRWLLPHFEKMLYDNALLARSYLEASRAANRDDFVPIVRELFGWIEREMTDPGGGFYSALDADSPAAANGGQSEGGFYTWTPGELRNALGPAGARVFGAWYGVTNDGVQRGRSVLHSWRTPAEVADQLGIDRLALDTQLRFARETLRKRRSERAHPARDDKILAAWNGLMISSLARAGFALAEPQYIDRAARAADFVLGTMHERDRLHRVSLAGIASGPAFLEDYAFLIAGLLDLYQCQFDPRWLQQARALQAELDAHYADSDGAYYRTADDAEVLFVRERPSEDSALPSGASVEALNLLRMAELLADSALRERAARLIASYATQLASAPDSLSEMLLALEYRQRNIREIALVAPEGAAPATLEAMLTPLRSRFLPGQVRAVAREGADLRSQAQVVPWLAGKRALAGRVTAYVCENRVCALPTSDPRVFAEQLERAATPPAQSPDPSSSSTTGNP